MSRTGASQRALTVIAAAGWALASMAVAGAGAAEDRFAGVEVAVHPVRGNVHMLTGAGGNIGASVGPDGTLIIDDQFAPLAERIVQALDDIDGEAPKIILNTHFHGDHVGGNPVFSETGTVVAHDNVRLRLLDDEQFPARGLPQITFGERIEVHFNGDTLEVLHMPGGHTDGDSVVWFRDANVLHTGDLLFKDVFPFIDLEHGGSVAGVIVNLTRLVEMLPDDVRIIPGHGPLADKGDLRRTLDMIRATRAEVSEALERGLAVDEVVAQGLDPRWQPWGEGLIDEERWIRTLAASAEAP